MDLSVFDRIAEPGYLDGLASLPIDELRRRRGELATIEQEISYLRRLVQGYLEILLDEGARRAQGRRGSVSDLVEGLATVLASRIQGGSSGRYAPSNAPAEGDPGLTAELDEFCTPDVIARVPEHDDEEISVLIGRLTELERTVSTRRSVVHRVQDALSAELGRRYQVGEASVDTLLG